jgi:hypothetical protein
MAHVRILKISDDGIKVIPGMHKSHAVAVEALTEGGEYAFVETWEYEDPEKQVEDEQEEEQEQQQRVPPKMQVKGVSKPKPKPAAVKGKTKLNQKRK